MLGVIRAYEPRSLERVVVAVYGRDAEAAFTLHSRFFRECPSRAPR